MAQLFDAEVLNIALRFTNPDKPVMVDAAKMAANLSMILDSVVRKHIAAGAAIKDINDGIKKLGPELSRLEKRAGLVAGQAAAIREAQKILSRYTPARVEKMAEFQAMKIAEKVGVTEIGRQFQKIQKDLEKVLAPAAKGIQYPATKNSPIGRGLFIDTETLGLNKFKHQVVEVTATMFEFEKSTGRITNQMVKTYHGLQDLAVSFREQKRKSTQPLSLSDELAEARKIASISSQSLRRIAAQTGENAPKRLPEGLTRAELRGKAISQTALLNLFRQSDFAVAHNAPFDKPRIEEIVPQLLKKANTRQWLDSARDISWKARGFSNAQQQTILSTLGINPGQAHRSTDDVSSGIAMLSKQSPVTGQPYLGVMLSKYREKTQAQQLVGILRDRAAELMSEYQSRLGDFSRSQWSSDVSARSRRPAHSTEYGLKKGAGQAPQPTPAWLGASGITLQNRLASIAQYHRYATIAESDPDAAANFLGQYEIVAARKEYAQRKRGSGRQSRENIRMGDELEMAIMGAVSRYYENKEPGSYRGGPGGGKYNLAEDYKDLFVHKVLAQKWAKPDRTYSNQEIEKFIEASGGQIGAREAATAAQMLRYRNERFNDVSLVPYRARSTSAGTLGAITGGRRGDGGLSSALADIVYRGFSSASGAANQRSYAAYAAQYEVPAGLLGPASGSSGKSGRASRSRFNSAVQDFFKDESGFQDFSSMFKYVSDLFKNLRSKKAGQEQTERILSGEDIKASMRYDAFEARLRRLTDTVEATTRAFEHYRDKVYPQRMEDNRAAFEARRQSIDLGRASAQVSTEGRYATIDSQRARNWRVRRRGLEDVDEKLVSTQSDLAMKAVEARLDYQRVFDKTQRALAKLDKQDWFNKLDPTSQRGVKEQVNAPLQRADIKKAKAEYAARTAGLTDQDRIDTERIKLARVYARQNIELGVPGRAASIDDETRRIAALMSGRTPGQAADAKAARIKEDAKYKREELAASGERVGQKAAIDEAKAAQARLVNEQKFATAEKRLQDELSKRQQDALAKRQVAERKAHEERVKFDKKEAEIAARGGGRGGGVSGGLGGRGRLPSGAGDDFGSRSGLGLGVGFAMMSAYLGVMRDVIKESTIYAARTETMALVTDQMAKVNGLNTDAVEAQVNAIRKLNITTQSANTVVQKMMFAQLDVAKATNLARTAQDSAILANVNSSEALDRIILGIVTGQTRVLHNMGLQVSMVNVMRQIRSEKRARGEEGEPTEVEKRQAMLNKVLMEGAKIMGTYERSMLTAGKQYTSLVREIQEAENAIGKEFLPTFGRFVSLTTQGLHFVQENGSAFAKLATAIASVGTAASTVGTLSFIKWIMSSPAVPWQAKFAGAAVGLATYQILNQDQAEAQKTTAQEQQDILAKKVQDLRAERKKLLSSRNNSSEWDNAWKVNTQALESLTNNQVAINEELTKQLADQYNKRLEDFDAYTERLAGKKGRLLQAWASLSGTVMPDASRDPITGMLLIPNSGESREEAKNRLLSRLATEGISKEDIKAEAERQTLREHAVQQLGQPLYNKTLMDAQAAAAGLIQLDSALTKAEEKRADIDGASLRARKSMASPREKIQIEYEENVHKLDKFSKEIRGLRADEAKGGAAGTKAKTALDAIYEQLGGRGHTEEGKKKVDEIIDKYKLLKEEFAGDRDIEFGKLNRQTAAAVLQTKEQIKIDQIRANMVQGNYASERKAIEDTFKVRQSDARKTLGLISNVDDYQKQVAQNEVERQTAIIELGKRARDAATERVNARVQRQTDSAVKEMGRYSLGLTPDEFFQRSYEVQAEGIRGQVLSTDEKRRALANLKDDIKQNRKDWEYQEAQAKAQDFVSRYSRQLELDSVIKRAQESPGQSEFQKEMADIERRKKAAKAIADTEYNQGDKFGDLQRPELERRKKASYEEADSRAAAEKIQALENRREYVQHRILDNYERQLHVMSRMREVMADNAAEESAAAENNYKDKIAYIDNEYRLRKKHGDEEEAAREMRQRKQEANMERLEYLRGQQRQQLDQLRNFSASWFDIMTSKSIDRQRMARDASTNILRGIGRSVFSNLTTEVFKKSAGILGDAIPGQQKEEYNPKTGKIEKKPTFLGKILAGTPLGKGPDEKEIAELQRVAVKENTSQEMKLTTAVENLTNAINDAIKMLPDIPSVSSGIVADSGGLTGLTNFIGGNSSGLSSIFNLGQSGSGLSIFSGLKNVLSGGSGISSAFSEGGGSMSDVGGVFSEAGGVTASGVDPTGWGHSTAELEKLGATLKTSKGGLGNWGTGKGIATNAMALAGGALDILSGIKKGGASGVFGGIAGGLEMASAIPGAAPFTIPAAMVAHLISSIFGNSRERRAEQERKEIRDALYMAPPSVDVSASMTGTQTRVNRAGQIESTPWDAFRYKVNDPYYVNVPNTDGQYKDVVPGTVVYMTVHAADAKSFIDQRNNLATAVMQAMQESHPLNMQVQKASGR